MTIACIQADLTVIVAASVVAQFVQWCTYPKAYHPMPGVCRMGLELSAVLLSLKIDELVCRVGSLGVGSWGLEKTKVIKIRSQPEES